MKWHNDGNALDPVAGSIAKEGSKGEREGRYRGNGAWRSQEALRLILQHCKGDGRGYEGGRIDEKTSGLCFLKLA